MECPVKNYADKVLSGEILAGELIKLSCERHLKDLKTSPAKGFYFDHKAAAHAIEFFSFLRLWEGEWAGCAFGLSPWQQFIVGSLFGWKNSGSNLRRFREGYIEVPRKNGKSPLVAGIGLYLLMADNEPGAQIFSAATKRDQAKIVWNHARNMLKRSPALRDRVQVFRSNSNLCVLETESKFEPLGADADTMDGLNIHGGLIDELHAHKTRAVCDVMETATSARRQPLIIYITTAGFDQTSICYEKHEYSVKILKQTVTDDTIFAYIATLDEDDLKNERWDNPKVWQKANPNYGISVKPDDLKRKCAKAKELPSSLNSFLRLHLNVWTQQAERWIPLPLWDENAGIVNEARLVGQTCYGGLDLSSVSDLTAWVLVFPREEDPEAMDVLARFWCPGARLTDGHNKYREQYQTWARQGLLKTTPGDAIDYAFIKAQILKDAETFKIVDMNIDRLFQSHQLAMELADAGLRVAGMGQGFMSMAVPVKEFQRKLLARKLHHGGNPVLRWMADNVVVKHDPAGNLKPDKAAAQGKIDGIVALIMALDRAMRHENNESVYEKRGMRSL